MREGKREGGSWKKRRKHAKGGKPKRLNSISVYLKFHKRTKKLKQLAQCGENSTLGFRTFSQDNSLAIFYVGVHGRSRFSVSVTSSFMVRNTVSRWKYFLPQLNLYVQDKENEPSWRKQLCFKNETCVHVPQKPRLLKSWSRKCLVYVLTVKQKKTCSRPNELLTALAPTWPHENITAELYRLLQIWSIAKNNMWTRTTLFQSTHLFF